MNINEESQLIKAMVGVLIENKSFDLEDTEFLEQVSIPGFNMSEPENTDEIKKRFSYLKYGFQARCRNHMEETFPRTKALMSVKDWNEIGSDYSIHYGNKTIHLQWLGRSFSAYLRLNSLPCKIWQMAKIEWSIKELGFSADHSTPEASARPVITETSCIQLRPAIRILKSLYNENLEPEDYNHDNYLILARAANQIRIRQVDSKIVQILKIFRKKKPVSILENYRLPEEKLYSAFGIASAMNLFHYSEEPEK